MTQSSVVPLAEGVFAGVPTFFRACCHEARHGGHWGYDHPGREIVHALARLLPYDMGEEDWLDEVERLDQLSLDQQDDAAWGWFQSHFPTCMKLVPSKRKFQFLAGVRSGRGLE